MGISLIAAIKGTLQTAKDKLADLRARKEQLLTQLQSVQDMLGREQGLFWDGWAGSLCSLLCALTAPKAASSLLLDTSETFLSLQRTQRRQSRMPKQLLLRRTKQLREWRIP